MDLPLLVDVAPIASLELEVFHYVRVYEDLDKLPVTQHELGDEVHIVVIAAAELLWSLLALAELFPELK